MLFFKDILLVVDGREGQEAALKRAVDLATANQSRLTVLAVLAEMPRLMARSWSADLQQIMVQERRSELEKLVEGCGGAVPVAIEVRQGTLFLEVIRQVLQQGHDLVLKTVQKQNVLQRIFFGSEDMHLLRKCPCPLWLLKKEEHEKYRCIVAAVDIEPSDDDETVDVLNRQIIEMAAAVAFAEFSELHIVHAWHVDGKSMLNSLRFKSQREEVLAWMNSQSLELEKRHKVFEKQLRALLGAKEQDYLHLTVHMLEGYADQVIPQFAQEIEADLVVMGTVARTGLPGFLMGNTAEGILNQINCSVLAIKPESFVTPVTLEDTK